MLCGTGLSVKPTCGTCSELPGDTQLLMMPHYVADFLWKNRMSRLTARNVTKTKDE